MCVCEVCGIVAIEKFYLIYWYMLQNQHFYAFYIVPPVYIYTTTVLLHNQVYMIVHIHCW